MRIIVIRHAESTNNLLSKDSYESYATSRTEDPKITEKGVQDCVTVGKFLSECNFPIDKCKSIFYFTYYSLFKL
jgi:broad specificity phosphatase PhoE